MAKRAIHSIFEGRYRIRVEAREGDSADAQMLRDLVSDLTRRQGLGVAQEWIMGAIYERFARERAAQALLDHSLAGGVVPVVHLSHVSHVHHQPQSPVRSEEPVPAPPVTASPSRVEPSSPARHEPDASAHSESEESEYRMEVPVTSTVQMTPQMRKGLRGAM